MVKKLKGVPGLPQGGKLFYDKFSGVLCGLGFEQSMADKCLFIRGRDISLQLGVLNEFLGLRIVRDRARKRMSITQQTMIKSLEKSGMLNANPVPVPCAGGLIFTRKKNSPKKNSKRATSALLHFVNVAP